MTSATTKKRPRNWRSAKAKIRHSKQESNEYRMLEKMFYYYNDTKAKVKEIKDEQGYYQSGYKEGGGSSNHAFISDPTSQLAIKHTEEIKSVIIRADTPAEDTVRLPERKIFVVEQTLKHFEGVGIIRDVMVRRYLLNESYVSTCTDLNIENADDYYEAKDIGLQYARECAIQIGLITVF